MEQTVEEFFHDFRQGLMTGAEANEEFHLTEFMKAITDEISETGFIEGFEECHYRAKRGMRVDGFWFNNDEDSLDLFVADFDNRDEIVSLTRTEVASIFKRAVNFFEASKKKDLHCDLEETSPEYGLARQIADRGELIRQVNFYLLSERVLSERLQELEDDEVAGVRTKYHVWDISRLHRQRSSQGQKEALDIDFQEMFGNGISCLPAHFGSDSHQSYLIVIPGEILSELYEKFGARLLEQNVRSFLQARNKVNRGIRSTILKTPEMFFAYNNGITATAQKVETSKDKSGGLQITKINDLQIVNGGQTTASMFHTRRKDKISLEKVFVQMKLSVVPPEASETTIPKISEYANTQNRMNASDFFSNHPFHIRMQESSRRIWAPAQQGAQRETKWFYERTRGQYADAQSKLTPAERRRFKAEYPKPQMLTKTDLAKFENVWDGNPKWVNLGAQRNFSEYIKRISELWKKDEKTFNEYYYKRAIARGIIFRRTEKLIPEQPWYDGGYRANMVAYSIAMINEVSSRREKTVNFLKIWDNQSLSQPLLDALAITAKYVNDIIMQPPEGYSNISQWCKQDSCWTHLKSEIEKLEKLLLEEFWGELIAREEQAEEIKSARKTQKIDDGISIQKEVLEIPARDWAEIARLGREKKVFSPKELEVLNVATQIPKRIPSEKQCAVLIKTLRKAEEEGIKTTEA